MCLYCEEGDSSGSGLKRYICSSEIIDVYLKVIIIIIMVIIIIDTIYLKRFVCSNVIHHHISLSSLTTISTVHLPERSVTIAITHTKLVALLCEHNSVDLGKHASRPAVQIIVSI